MEIEGPWSRVLDAQHGLDHVAAMLEVRGRIRKDRSLPIALERSESLGIRRLPENGHATFAAKRQAVIELADIVGLVEDADLVEPHPWCEHSGLGLDQQLSRVQGHAGQIKYGDGLPELRALRERRQRPIHGTRQS